MDYVVCEDCKASHGVKAREAFVEKMGLDEFPEEGSVEYEYYRASFEAFFDGFEAGILHHQHEMLEKLSALCEVLASANYTYLGGQYVACLLPESMDFVRAEIKKLLGEG